MKKILSYIPPFIIHLTIFIFGIVLLLHTLGFFQKGLDKLLIIISIFMIICGFVELGGIQACKKLLTKDTNNSNNTSSDSLHDDDDNCHMPPSQ